MSLLTNRYPVTEYYKEHVVDGITVSRGGGWWTAILLIEDPKTKGRFLNLYRWESNGDEWKTRKTFTIRDRGGLDKIVKALSELREKLPE
jgi:hypothetical protein